MESGLPRMKKLFFQELDVVMLTNLWSKTGFKLNGHLGLLRRYDSDAHRYGRDIASALFRSKGSARRGSAGSK